ncbi:glycosyltransferase family 9 protein [Bdellovibrio sp. SKB1291214]|uniref:glycosyltransferase family 9 protein n=1 Tax=Bdellovibrio sp. SKB1291214 TaxID=1732569 RepID=UPI002240B3A8|nr:glycosyltransferase family 9 protein [Bdellovibrio sp. SKB1291214]UYL10053.1 glycosyltransferase family 9 protein [Bdellovibrio sp. SKB1291214]
MKILVVSLLRLGDIIQQQPLLKALRDKNPQAEIHLLVNRQFSQVEGLLDGLVDRYFYFDRETLQRGLGEASFNILWSHQQLAELVQTLNAENYGQVLNFTHNKLSAYLLGALQIPQKNGLYHAEGRFQGLENPWLRYFNDRFSGVQPSLFHYVELLGKSFDLPIQKTAAAAATKSKLVLFQCLTSDTKKNWGLLNFKKLKETIESSLVDYKVKVLCAPFEKGTMLAHFSEDELIACDLMGAREVLKQSCLLVTGDTSIKHMAAHLGIPMVELALGSSDFTKTAAFSETSEIISAKVPCAPCGHSQGCSQKFQICAEQITVDQVFAAAWDKLSKKNSPSAFTLGDLDKIAWSLQLDGGSQSHVLSYASTALKCSESFPKNNLGQVLTEATRLQKQFEKWLQALETSLPSRQEISKKAQLKSQDIGQFILTAQDILKSKQDTAGYFQSITETLMTRFSSTLQFHEKMQTALAEVRGLLQSRGQFIHSLEIVLKEGAYYAAGIGQLSIDGFEEAGGSVPRDREDAAL